MKFKIMLFVLLFISLAFISMITGIKVIDYKNEIGPGAENASIILMTISAGSFILFIHLLNKLKS